MIDEVAWGTPEVEVVQAAVLLVVALGVLAGLGPMSFGLGPSALMGLALLTGAAMTISLAGGPNSPAGKCGLLVSDHCFVCGATLLRMA